MTAPHALPTLRQQLVEWMGERVPAELTGRDGAGEPASEREPPSEARDPQEESMSPEDRKKLRGLGYIE